MLQVRIDARFTAIPVCPYFQIRVASLQIQSCFLLWTTAHFFLYLQTFIIIHFEESRERFFHVILTSYSTLHTSHFTHTSDVRAVRYVPTVGYFSLVGGTVQLSRRDVWYVPVLTSQFCLKLGWDHNSASLQTNALWHPR